MADFRGFGWEQLMATQRAIGWGELTSNLLLVGQRGNTTPAHYDEQQNVFAQLHGTKRCVLFSPANFDSLYPFPLHHPNDRQSQVDFFAPDSDRTRFPRFGAAQPYEAVLSAGELLFIPQYWWHHIENTSEGCVSLNFWFKDQSRPAQVTLPLLPHQDLAMRRNIERMVGDRLGARAAQLALPSLPSPKTAEAKALREEVVHLLRHVVAEENIDEWIEGLVGGRFALPPPLAA